MADVMRNWEAMMKNARAPDTIGRIITGHVTFYSGTQLCFLMQLFFPVQYAMYGLPANR